MSLGGKRIGLFIDTDNYGGAESVVMALATHLAKAGHALFIYHFGNPYLEKLCVELGATSRRVSHRQEYKRQVRLPWFAYHFSRALRADRLELLHSHLFGPIVAGGVSCRLAGIPHVGTLHDVYIVEERPIRARLLRLVQLLGTRLVCVSEQMAGYYARVTHVPRAKLRVIRNGVDLRLYAAARREQRAHRLVRIVMVGRLDPIKRHDLLLSALSGLVDDPTWEAVIVGDGPQRESLLAQCRSLGLESRVAFLGQRSDVPALLATADIFALVSDSEGMSLSLIEAIASGLPVIATTVGNNAELVRDGWNGLLLAPGSRADLERALRTLIRDGAARAAYAAHSLTLSGEQLDLQRALAAYEQLYAEALGR